MTRRRTTGLVRPSSRAGRRALGVLAVFSLLAAAGVVAAPSGAGAASAGPSADAPCGTTAAPGHAICLTRIPEPNVTSPATALPTAQPTVTTLGLTAWPHALYPGDVTTAYGWQGSDVNTGTGKTIALVDAYNDPTIATDLTTFSTQFGLPACTTTNGCFTKVSQTGGTTYPSTTTSGWDTEISLDVEYAHAMAPKAKLLLVEATTTSFANLFTAVSYAAAHAQYVSMSWGGTEFSTEATYDRTFTTYASTDSFFAAAGDTAEAVLYPSASPDVVSVGGTKLTVTFTSSTRSKATWDAESGWVDGGGGCSVYEPAAAAQAAFPPFSQAGVTCGGKRGTPDVAADASPTTGVAVYDTEPTTLTHRLYKGWFQIGGTSLATPLWAAHSAADGVHVTATYVYGRYVPYYHITTGGNGHDCVPGYNLCDGLGSWSTSHGTLNKEVPTAPTNLRKTAGTATSVSLAWAAPTSTGGTPIDHYLLFRTGTLYATLSTALTDTVTGLSAATPYHFTVEAENSTGTSGPSNTLSVTTTPSPPPPVGFTAPGTGTGSVTIGAIAPRSS